MCSVLEAVCDRANYRHSLIMVSCDCYELVSMSKFIFPCLSTQDMHIYGRDISSEAFEVETVNLMLSCSELLI